MLLVLEVLSRVSGRVWSSSMFDGSQPIWLSLGRAPAAEAEAAPARKERDAGNFTMVFQH